MKKEFHATQTHHMYCVWVGTEPTHQSLINQFNSIPSTSVVLVLFESIISNDHIDLSQNSRVHIQFVRKDLWILDVSCFQKNQNNPESQLFLDINIFRSKRTHSFHSLAPLGSKRPLVTSLVTHIQQKLLEYWRNNPTITYLSTRWISNLTRNLTYIQKRFNDSIFSWIPPSKPVLLLGAGPGLWRFREEILQITNTHYVLALDTCLPIITQWGINPDGILIVESQYWNNLDFIPLGNRFFDDFSGDVFLDLTANPQILRSWKCARTWYFLSRFAEISLIESLGQLITTIPPLGNVGCIGVYLLGLLRFEKATLVGLDFSQSNPESMTSGGHHHNWYLSHCNRFSSLPISKQVSQPRDQNPFLSTPIYERDYSILQNLAQRLPLEIDYLSGLRPSWNSPRSQTQDTWFWVDHYFFIESNQILNMLKEQVHKALICVEDEINDPLEYFSTCGSFFTLNVPGSIPLANPEHPEQIHSFILLGIKRILFEINRGLEK